MLDDLEQESQVAVGGSSSRSSRMVVVHGSQDTTVVAPSIVDLHPRPEVVVFSDGTTVAEVSLCQGGLGCARCVVLASVGCVSSNTGICGFWSRQGY